MLTSVAHGHRLGRRGADGTQPAGHRTTRFPFITQADFHETRGLRELSVGTTGATTTLAGGGPSGYHFRHFKEFPLRFKDDDVGANALFSWPFDVAIDPSGAFALVAVRDLGPLHPACHALPQQRRPRLAHTRQAHTAALQGVIAAATPRRRLAPRSVCTRARCIAQDSKNHCIRRVDITTGATTTLAGNGIAGFKDDDVGTSARFSDPLGVAIAPDGTFALVTVRA